MLTEEFELYSKSYIFSRTTKPLYTCLITKAFWLKTGKGASTSITGTKIGPELSAEDKIWRVFSSMGNIALACTYATVIYDIMVKKARTHTHTQFMD